MASSPQSTTTEPFGGGAGDPKSVMLLVPSSLVLAKSRDVREKPDVRVRPCDMRKRNQLRPMGKVQETVAILEASLQITEDSRFKRMDAYHKKEDIDSADSRANRMQDDMDHRAGDSATSGFADHVQDDVRGGSMLEVVSREMKVGKDKPRQSAGALDDRMQWQDRFNRQVRRLLVDFQLSDMPTCRLNHLNRMHDWFADHGAKQARKADPGPNYLTTDRCMNVLPAGSARNIPKKDASVLAEHPLKDIFPRNLPSFSPRGNPSAAAASSSLFVTEPSSAPGSPSGGLKLPRLRP